MARRKNIEDVERLSSLKFFGGIVVLGIIVVGGAIFIGRSDSGQINVSATIQESNQTQSAEGGEQVQAVSQTFQNMPNGGLVPQESQPMNDSVQTEEVNTNENTDQSTTTEQTETTEGGDAEENTQDESVTE